MPRYVGTFRVDGHERKMTAEVSAMTGRYQVEVGGVTVESGRQHSSDHTVDIPLDGHTLRVRFFGRVLPHLEVKLDDQIKYEGAALDVLYVLAGLVGTIALSLVSVTAVLLGIRSPQLAANGIIATALFVFILSLLVFYRIGPDEENFLQTGAVRTAIAISFTVAYVQLLAYSLVASELGLNFDNPVMSNFFTVYIAVITFYFGSATIEKVKQIDAEVAKTNRPPS